MVGVETAVDDRDDDVAASGRDVPGRLGVHVHIGADAVEDPLLQVGGRTLVVVVEAVVRDLVQLVQPVGLDEIDALVTAQAIECLHHRHAVGQGIAVNTEVAVEPFRTQAQLGFDAARLRARHAAACAIAHQDLTAHEGFALRIRGSNRNAALDSVDGTRRLPLGVDTQGQERRGAQTERGGT